MSGFDIGASTLELNCPCGAKVPFTLAQAANEETIVCGSCKRKINLIDNNGSSKKAIHDTNAAMDGLKRSVDDLNRKLKF